MAKLHPLGDHIIVKPSKPEEVTKSGIVLPSSSSDKSEQGEVVAIGPGKLNEDGKRIPMTVKAGDTVLYTKYGPTEVKVEGKEIFFIQESDVLAVVEK